MACTDTAKPKVVYSEDLNDTSRALLKQDTASIVMSQLPIHFDSTHYLIFPIGQVQVQPKRGSKIYFGSGGSGSKSFSFGYKSGYSFEGNFENLHLQHVDSNRIRPLFNKPVQLRYFHFLESARKKLQNELIILSVTDSDTNNDRKLTIEDVESLYIAALNGSDIKKLTNEFQELLDWEVLEVNNRLYFRSIEDLDRNGEFDKNDKIHYYFLDLNDPFSQTVEYNPL